MSRTPSQPETPIALPEKPALEGLEAKWRAKWEAAGVYRFDRTATRDEVYAIDTPPPTVSGSLHVGHVFSYTHTDILARYHRMRGRAVFYPMGWDDNGLPTERRVQNYFGVRCDPSLPYDPSFEPPEKPGKHPISVSRPNFIELCERLTAEDEKAFEALWRTLGLSVDWAMTYSTVSKASQRVSQRAFLRLLEKGIAYQLEAPTLWDVDFRTAVAQAELEDRETPGAYHKLRFTRADGQPIEIDTTRPELLPACVALVAHPDDPRYQSLFGTEIVTPLFKARVPFKAHPLANPEKGTGVAMICTFGDITDVTWWRELNLPVRAVIQPDGRLRPVTWGGAGWESDDVPSAQAAYDQLAGQTANKARAAIAELLKASGELIGDVRPITHPVKYYEKGDRPLEIVTSRQWFVKTIEFRDQLLARGRELTWYPPFMQSRYQNWVEGLNGDWCVSRQRFFGVPFPVWYPIDANGVVQYGSPLLPAEARLPVDPSTDVPEGYTAAQRDQPGGFTGDPDVMDTWATSSLTPQIAGKWEDDPDLFARVFPMDLRPQAHEIIRTWLFYTVARAHYEHDSLPWKTTTISGWVLDPDRKKMSKSKGNVVTPMALLDEHGSDGVRYWAASGRPGTDTAFDPGQMKVGRRLAMKLLNASRFALSQSEPRGPITVPVDRAMITSLARLLDEATAEFDQCQYATVLERAERWFWSFCDDYLELVKSRRYGAQGPELAGSANSALVAALSVLLRLFAPFQPFVTEEVWSWWHDGSVHTAPWPTSRELLSLIGGADESAAPALERAALVLGEVRKTKSEAKRKLSTPVTRLVVRDTADRLDALRAAEADLVSSGFIETLVTEEAETFAVEVTLAPPETPAAGATA
jgi:valyl-tRNA synthetase